MIKNFLNHILCIKCHNKITINNIYIKRNRIKNGSLICKYCNVEYKIKNGVINFSVDKSEDIHKIYSDYWKQLPINFKRNEDLNEVSIFKKFSKNLKNKIIFDAGCGDGRSIKTICSHKPKLLLVGDFTDVIYYTAKNFSNKFKNIPIIFIKIDLSEKFISKNYINSVISLGSINFKINQKRIIKNLDTLAKNFLMIGLVSNNSFFGKFYQRLNLVRIIFKLKIMSLIILFLKFLFLNKFIRYFRIISILGDLFYSFLEFILSPIILRHDDIFYKKLVKKKNITIYTGKLLDYLVFRLK